MVVEKKQQDKFSISRENRLNLLRATKNLNFVGCVFVAAAGGGSQYFTSANDVDDCVTK